MIMQQISLLKFSIQISFLFRKKKTNKFITDALEARLRMTVPYLDKWPQVRWSFYDYVRKLKGLYHKRVFFQICLQICPGIL